MLEAFRNQHGGGGGRGGGYGGPPRGYGMMGPRGRPGPYDRYGGGGGGGLVVRSDDGSWILPGIVSFGKGCGDAHFPGVYTRF